MGAGAGGGDVKRLKDASGTPSAVILLPPPQPKRWPVCEMCLAGPDCALRLVPRGQFYLAEVSPAPQGAHASIGHFREQRGKILEKAIKIKKLVLTVSLLLAI